MPKIDLGKVIGKDFKYEDFTPEQLKALQIKGDAGDNKINVVKDGVKTREDLTLQQEGKFTKIVSGTSNSHKLLASDILTEDGNSIMDTVNQFGNPNLLNNSYFAKPINQRGLSKYVVNQARTYTIDRWCLLNKGLALGGSLEVLTDSIKLKKGSTDIWINQSLEDKIMHNGSLTFSVSAKSVSNNLAKALVNLNGRIDSILSPGTAYEYSSGISEFNLKESFDKYIITFNNIPKEIKYFCVSIGSLLDTEDLEIEWVKLEIGSIATPFVPRTYAEELVLCKRYYLKFGSGFVTFADFSVYDNRIEFLMHKSFRITPTVKVTGGIVCYAIEGFSNMVYTNPSVVASADGYCSIFGTTIPYGKTGIIQTNGPGCLIEFDAEIY